MSQNKQHPKVQGGGLWSSSSLSSCSPRPQTDQAQALLSATQHATPLRLLGKRCTQVKAVFLSYAPITGTKSRNYFFQEKKTCPVLPMIRYLKKKGGAILRVFWKCTGLEADVSMAFPPFPIKGITKIEVLKNSSMQAPQGLPLTPTPIGFSGKYLWAEGLWSQVFEVNRALFSTLKEIKMEARRWGGRQWHKDAAGEEGALSTQALPEFTPYPQQFHIDPTLGLAAKHSVRYKVKCY